MEFCLAFTFGKIIVTKHDHSSSEMFGKELVCACLSKGTFKYPFQDIVSRGQISSTIVQEILSKNGSFLENSYWHRQYSEGSGFDASAVSNGQFKVHFQSLGHIQLVTHIALTVSNVLMRLTMLYRKDCEQELLQNNYPLKKKKKNTSVENYLPQTN